MRRNQTKIRLKLITDLLKTSPKSNELAIKIGRFLIMLITLSSCNPAPMQDQDVATAWADMTVFITKKTPANSPTYASRCLGYIGLTMYESVVQGDSVYQSLAKQLNGLDSLPQQKQYHQILALNAGQAQILRNIYAQTSDVNKSKIDSLETLVRKQFSASITDNALIDRSINHGKAIANKIFEWSKTDGGHRGYLKNFDKKMKYPNHQGAWKPPLYAQSFSHYPLHPHWGDNRTFLAKNAQIPKPNFIAHDTLKGSKYYTEFEAVYQKQKALTQAEKEIAIWWSDDPDETPTPPGHSYYLATLAIKKAKPSLIKTTETYAKVGMAVADAFVDCWKWKYLFFTERPNTFIPQHIDIRWESFWPEPPFPAFPSGHAIQAAATATVLTELYGQHFVFTDNIHQGRPRDEQRNTDFRSRQYQSFWEAAQETADSRFYGGIHSPQDNQAGIEKGKAIGLNINTLDCRK